MDWGLLFDSGLTFISDRWLFLNSHKNEYDPA